MAKIKIVQIAIASDSENGPYAEYLDDQGRIWFQVSHKNAAHVWITEWKQLELPDDPREATA